VQLSPDQIREQVKKLRAQTSTPINLNVFCHAPAVPGDVREAAWREQLAP
jgi:nitronate monooxygenase